MHKTQLDTETHTNTYVVCTHMHTHPPTHPLTPIHTHNLCTCCWIGLSLCRSLKVSWRSSCSEEQWEDFNTRCLLATYSHWTHGQAGATPTNTDTHAHTHTCSEIRHKLGCYVCPFLVAPPLFFLFAISKVNGYIVTTQTVYLIRHNHYDSIHDPSLLTKIVIQQIDIRIPKFTHTFTVTQTKIYACIRTYSLSWTQQNRVIYRFTCAYILTLMDTTQQNTLHTSTHINQTY